MSKERRWYWIGFSVGVGVTFLAAAYAALSSRNEWRARCVTRGAAEWVVDDNGSTEFKWLLEPKERS